MKNQPKMNSVKFGQRSGRFKAVEDEMIKELRTNGVCRVYPNINRFKISELVEDLEYETKLKIGFEEIIDSTTKFNPHCNSLVIAPKLIGYKIFLK